ncbi:Protein of unknown function [Bacillus mobilis]|jgi:two-component system sporulation sensor kinase A
MAEV